MEALDTSTGITYAAGVQICPDSSTRQNVIVKLEQERPEILDLAYMEALGLNEKLSVWREHARKLTTTCNEECLC